MNVTGKTMIFRKDFNGRPAYSRQIKSREFVDGQQTDNWIRTYESVKLPKDSVLSDGSIIDVTRGFESVFKSSDGSIKRQLIVMDYSLEKAGNVSDDAPSGFMAMDDNDNIPF